MIIFYVGTPGSGKTYEAVRRILSNLQLGRVVYTNIEGLDLPHCQEAIKSYCGLSDLALVRLLKFLNPDQLSDFWNHVEPGALIVLDEIHKIFSSREFQSKANKQFGFWASTHRHQGFDLILITQAVERVDSAVRALTEWTYVFRKVNFFGSLVKKQYLCYSYNGEDTAGEPLRTERRSYDPKVFVCYSSYVSKDIKEQGFQSHVNVLKHPVFYAIPCVLGLVIYLLFFKSSLATGDIFGAKKAMTDAQARTQKKQESKAEKVEQIKTISTAEKATAATSAKPEKITLRLDSGIFNDALYFLWDGRWLSSSAIPCSPQKILGSYFCTIANNSSSVPIEDKPTTSGPAGGFGLSSIALTKHTN